MSDSDIRRAMLRETLSVARVRHNMNINCRTTIETTPPKQRAALRREGVTVLPVVNQANQLIDVVLAYEPLIGNEDGTVGAGGVLT